MARRTSKKTPKSKAKRVEKSDDSELVDKVAELLRREVDERLGPEATYEQRRDQEAELMRKILWKREDDDLRESATNVEEVEIGGKHYKRLGQPSSATYHGRWGKHRIEEPLYREVGVRNGPTIKPLEMRIGVIARRLTPDFARILGELCADENSRGVERTLQAVGLRPPSRSVIEKRAKLMAKEVAERIDDLEAASRAVEEVPAETVSISCGLDRFSVRMAEPAPAKASKRRDAPYVRQPPPPKDYRWRKAWVGSVSLRDASGKELRTLRYAAEANTDPSILADRVAADVAHILQQRPDLPVHVVQDAAPELRALPQALEQVLPSSAVLRTLIDFDHLTSNYLDVVVDTCEPPDDPHNMKSWFRGELLRDDGAIDRIWRALRERAKKLPGADAEARTAIAAALSYIRHRKSMMRYASHHAANLAIGSGATESTCWTMQQRVKRPAQSWEEPGLRGTLALRALVVFGRWDSAWNSYAASHRYEVAPIA